MIFWFSSKIGAPTPVGRVNDKRVDPATGERARFASAILPAWCRKSPKVTEVLPLLYLHGLSTSDFGPALGQFLGSSAGLSAPVIARLTQTRQGEQRAFAGRDLSGGWTTSTSGLTASMSPSAWPTSGCACWS